MKNKKIILCFIITMLFGVLLVQTTFATEVIGVMGDMGKNTLNTGNIGKIGSIINTAIGVIQYTGTGLAVIMVTILGIKYLIAAPNDKADVKKQIMPLVIGCIILFASVNLVQIVATFTTKLF